VMGHYILTLVCRDRIGIVRAVSGFLSDAGCNIVDSQQFGDTDTGRFFMRVHVRAEDAGATLNDLRAGFAPVASPLAMDWQIHPAAERSRTLIMVSRLGHCLNDLLYRWRIGALHTEIVAIVSNHTDFAELAASYQVPYHHLPVTAGSKRAQEAELLRLVEQQRIDLVILARYMQVLSDELCRQLAGRVINIHHSFLPSFRGASPYRQAYDRGVKLIGATAHYVTAELDEGPIIEQEVARVDHAHSPAELAAVGRDVESLALARAVQAHADHRVLINGSKTVIFR
jgi:formyltetrahydrofolate deformylase